MTCANFNAMPDEANRRSDALRSERRIANRVGMVSAVLALMLTADPAPAGFLPLGDLPGGQFGSFGLAVSGDGRVVVGQGSSSVGFEAFRWTQASGLLSIAAAPVSAANAASADGTVIVGRLLDLQPFRWTQATGSLALPFLPGGNQGEALDVSANGAVVVGQSNGVINGSSSGNLAFLWSPQASTVFLGDLPGGAFISVATGVSGDGSVVVGLSTSASGQEAFRWTQTTGMVGLGDLPGGSFLSVARGISADGSVIVGNALSASGNEAFRWTPQSGMIGLGDLPGGVFDSIAFDASENGSVIVGLSCTDLCTTLSEPEAFIWDDVNGMRNLRELLLSQGDDVSGWILRRATGVSADGRIIVGSGINPDGQEEAWLAVVNPAAVVAEPPTLLLLAAAWLGFLAAVIGASTRAASVTCRRTRA